MSKTKEKEEKESTLKNISVSSATTEVVQRYGSAIAEDVVAYSGHRLNTDGTLTSYQKSHSKIFTHKINPDYKDSNIAQQSGFSAEVHYTTEKNKENIINNSKIRTSRTDDVKNSDGSTRVNDTVSDIISFDEFGNVVAGSEGQMKFVNNPEKLCDKIARGDGNGGKGDLSRYQGKKLLLPKEQVEDAKKYCEEQAASLKKQAEYAKNPKISEKLKEDAEKFEELSKNIESTGFTREQAKGYRLNPIKETVKNIANTAHDAGIQGAQFGGAIGGTISLATNIYALYQGDKEVGEAVIDCAADTGKAVAVGYATGFAGSAIKGTMEQAHGVLVQRAIDKAGKELSKKATEKVIEEVGKSTAGKITKTIANLSKTNLPALAVTVCLEFGSIVRQYSRGEIDGVEFMEKAGEKGVGLAASSMMATVGQLAIPIPVVGAVIGGMIGYTLSSIFYNEALSSFKGAKEAHKNYLLVKARYEEAKRQREIYQARLQEAFNIHMAEQKSQITCAFIEIDTALERNDISTFAKNINSLGEMFNKKLIFKNRIEFDAFMQSDNTFIL